MRLQFIDYLFKRGAMFHILSEPNPPIIDRDLVISLLSFVGILTTLIWTIISTRQQRKDASENTKQMNDFQEKFTVSNRIRDQKIRRLERAREALIILDQSCSYIRFYILAGHSLSTPETIEKQAVLLSAQAEFRGLAAVINDKKLTAILSTPHLFQPYKDGEYDPNDEKSLTDGAITDLHQRMMELLDEATI